MRIGPDETPDTPSACGERMGRIREVDPDPTPRAGPPSGGGVVPPGAEVERRVVTGVWLVTTMQSVGCSPSKVPAV